MITTTDVANILYTKCKEFDMPIYQEGNIDDGRVAQEGRIVIHVKEQTAETYWKKGFAEVNLIVPDTPQKHADLVRLNELERKAMMFDGISGKYDDTLYQIKVSSTTMLENKELESHYINARLLVKVLNTIE